MNIKQKQIRKLIIIAFIVIGLLSVLISLKIESPKSKEKSAKASKYDIQEISSDFQKESSPDAATTLTGTAVSSEATVNTGAAVTQAAANAGETVLSNNSQTNPTGIVSNQNNVNTSQTTTEQQNQSQNVETKNTASQEQNQSIDSGTTTQVTTNQQQAQTNQQNSVPTPAPVPSEQAKQYITCTIEIRCDAISNDMSVLTDENMKQYIPADGTILSNTELKVEAGASVYDVLLQVCQNHGIQLDTDYTPMYKNYYVKSIQYLYEKKAGQNSGWRYMVNGLYPNYGCSSYKVQQGDSILWLYSLDVGN